MAVALRRADVADIAAIEAVYYPYARRHINVPRVSEALALYPSVVAFDGAQLLGFAYCFRFAPDIVELANIFVAGALRSGGLGTNMLRFLLCELRPPLAAVIAVNSDLYDITEEKRRPDGFYLRNGFSIISTTPKSTVFWWPFPSEMNERGE